MRLVSGVKYDDLLHRYQRMTEARDTAEELAAERLSTVTRQAAEITRLRDRLAAVKQPARGRRCTRCEQAEKRADRLQRELDAALGLEKGVPADSAPWQPGYKTPTPGSGVAS